MLSARSFRVSQIPNGSVYSCNTCHSGGGGSARNAFGLEIENNFLDAPGASGNVEWGPELASLDSDGDGFTNGEELQDPEGTWTPGDPNPGDPALVTSPGDPGDFPTSVNDRDDLVLEYSLSNNYPNPFNPSTTIEFSIPVQTEVNIEIFDINGKKVIELINQSFNRGKYAITWNADDDRGNKVNSGIYFYRLSTNDFIQTKSMVLLK